jgi:hypothetical protein
MDIWRFDDQAWRRSAGQGFALHDYRGLEAAAAAHGAHELAALVGARECPEEGEGVLYPGPFSHSPATGKPLRPPAPGERQIWLPPFGNSPSLGRLGLRQTGLALGLSATPGLEHAPDTQWMLPEPGEYQFMVGNFKARIPLLLAINPRQGRLFLRSGQDWQELTRQGPRLPGSSLAADGWGAWLDGREENRLYLPTDEGLAVLALNVLNLSYRLSVVPGQCLGAPAALEDWVAVPALGEGNRAGLLLVPCQEGGAAEWLDCAAVAVGGRFNAPLAGRSQVLWLNSHGQALLALDLDGRPTAGHIPWPDDGPPCFEFGSPYHARNGVLWQICYDRRAGRYHYVQLGSRTPDKQPCRSPVLTSGTACFARASQLRGPPWSEAGPSCEALGEDLLIPLLEAANAAVLCLRMAWIRGLDELFQSPIAHLAHYELIGHDGDVRLLTRRLCKPWLAQPFAHRGWLCLYHPDLDLIPAWKLA